MATVGLKGLLALRPEPRQFVRCGRHSRCDGGAENAGVENERFECELARGLRAERQSARMSKITNDDLTRSGTGCFIAVSIWQQWASKDRQNPSWTVNTIYKQPLSLIRHIIRASWTSGMDSRMPWSRPRPRPDHFGSRPRTPMKSYMISEAP